MSNLKDTVDRIRNLETEKLSLLAEIEDLKKMADVKTNSLLNEISALREDLRSLKVLMGQEKQAPPIEEHPKEKNMISAKDVAEMTAEKSENLGNQVFTISPFSQYFDDWLVNFQQIISEFESNPSVKVDEQFSEERSKILNNVENVLAQKKSDESKISEVTKTLDENNSLLTEVDKEFMEKSKELSGKRDPEIERLTYRIHELERDLTSQEESKNKMFKRKTAEKITQTKQDLDSAKHELEVTKEKLAAEQDKLYESHEKKKLEITERLEALHKELEKLEMDSSIEDRKEASKAFANAVNALVQRNP